ncbi:MAG: PilZ domain-containing protein [Acidobacteria bacterium]|nr:PilZ domain-containing protein [Acidobacteriota bacterium]MBU4330921.1 PilZ domain-containing protein [Acidobacteriota bacterium]MCG2815852.1 PilZ domain-containing protein [Candidatus Aminicenantes bacterium]
MSEDKRKYLRFDCTLPAEIINLEPGQELFKGAKIDDFSREGIKIILEFDVHPDTELDLNFRLPDSEKNVPVKAKVIWSRAKDSHIELGLRIEKMDADAKSDLFDYLYSQWRKSRAEELVPPQSDGKKS